MRGEVVVVGSGISGMMAAILLAGAGMRVVVVERNRRPGGLLQGFVRQGVRFSSGVHILGSMAPGQVLWRLLSFCGVAPRLRLVSLKEGGWLRVELPGAAFDLRVGHRAFRRELVAAFPRQAPAIDRLLEDMREAVEDAPLYRLAVPGEVVARKRHRGSLAAYLAGLTDDPRLRALLASLHPFHGVDPVCCPVFLHLLVLDSLVSGGYRWTGPCR